MWCSEMTTTVANDKTNSKYQRFISIGGIKVLSRQASGEFSLLINLDWCV